MESWENRFLSRDHASLARRLDRRVDLLAGLRIPNLVAAANLHMSAALTAIDARRRGRPWGITAALGCAVARALAEDPLPAASFDGRDRLWLPDPPALGISLDAGDEVQYAVVECGPTLGPDELAQRIARAAASIRKRREQLAFEDRPAPGLARYRRLARMVAQEWTERFDYLLPPLQKRRFAARRRAQGDFCIHNLGPHGVQAFKGHLRRPAVAALWALSAREQAVPAADGSFRNERRLPLVLVYSQALLPLDRACAFLGRVVSALEEPETAFGAPA